MFGHPDQEEGPRAFAEKREPVWMEIDESQTDTQENARP